MPVQMYYFILGVCHCVAFSSCVSNPVLYGWLNTNLRKEFLKVCQYDDDDDDDDDDDSDDDDEKPRPLQRVAQHQPQEGLPQGLSV